MRTEGLVHACWGGDPQLLFQVNLCTTSTSPYTHWSSDWLSLRGSCLRHQIDGTSPPHRQKLLVGSENYQVHLLATFGKTYHILAILLDMVSPLDVISVISLVSMRCPRMCVAAYCVVARTIIHRQRAVLFFRLKMTASLFLISICQADSESESPAARTAKLTAACVCTRPHLE